MLLLLSAWAPACGADASGREGGPIEVTVFAAASLTDAFEELGGRFEDANPGTRVTFNFLASSDLAAQIEQGAPAHVFASADETSMGAIAEAGLIEGQPQVFARNLLEIAVPPGNPGGVERLADLDDADLVVTLCAEECPAGRYATEIFDGAGLRIEPDSREPDVRAVLTRVETGEADAGIVYRTDIVAAGDAVEGIEIPDQANALATYTMATLVDAPGGAAEFVDLVLSGEGQSILREYGFLVG